MFRKMERERDRKKEERKKAIFTLFQNVCELPHFGNMPLKVVTKRSNAQIRSKFSLNVPG